MFFKKNHISYKLLLFNVLFALLIVNISGDRHNPREKTSGKLIQKAKCGPKTHAVTRLGLCCLAKDSNWHEIVVRVGKLRSLKVEVLPQADAIDRHRGGMQCPPNCLGPDETA